MLQHGKVLDISRSNILPVPTGGDCVRVGTEVYKTILKIKHWYILQEIRNKKTIYVKIYNLGYAIWSEMAHILFYMNKIPFLLRSSVPPFLRSSSLFSHFFASIGNAYRIWNNRRILTFKVSKGLYQSFLHDRIICKWRQCLLGGQKWN